MLPDRESATAQPRLASRPTIAIVAGDRGGGYGEAAAKALPHAVQVADRWHLMENASRAFLDAVRKSMRQIRSAIKRRQSIPKLLTAAERLQYEEYRRTAGLDQGLSYVTNDRYCSTLHRVMHASGHERYSVPFYVGVPAQTAPLSAAHTCDHQPGYIERTHPPQRLVTQAIQERLQPAFKLIFPIRRRAHHCRPSKKPTTYELLKTDL